MIDPETSHKFAKYWEKMELEQDDIIAEPGDPCDCFFILMSGSVQVSTRLVFDDC